MSSEDMRKRASRAISVELDGVVSKAVKSADVIALNRSMETVIRQNERERVISEQSVAGIILGGRL